MPAILSYMESTNKRFPVEADLGMNVKPCLKKYINQEGLRCGSSSRVPSEQVQSLKYKPQYCQKKAELLVECVVLFYFLVDICPIVK
jgi:hypothetical protein